MLHKFCLPNFVQINFSLLIFFFCLNFIYFIYRSSGNFGSAGAKSAPSTPHGLLTSSSAAAAVGLITDHNNSQPCSPGYISPSIQRSPSHNLFTKHDK